MRRVWSLSILLVTLLLVAAVAPIFYVEALCRTPMAGYTPRLGFASVLPAEERRREAASWLSYPHWHVVHSADSLGRHLVKAPPSSYPYWQDVRSFWTSYCLVNRLTADMGGADAHKLQVYTLGLRFSSGMLFKALYENSLGRVFEWIGGWQSDNDRHAVRVQQHYAAFIQQTPWYRFPYGTALGGLWATGIEDTPSSPAVAGERDRVAVEGPPSLALAAKGGGGAATADQTQSGIASFLRQWERRFALSGEYGIKTGFTKLIDAAMGAWGGVDADAPTLYLVARAGAGQLAAIDPRLRVVRSAEGGGLVAVAPRHAAFTAIVDRLAFRGIELAEIAGNDDVFVTLLTPRPLDTREGVVLMTHPLPERPELLRVGVSTKVPRLHVLLRDAKAAGATLERVYDY